MGDLTSGNYLVEYRLRKKETDVDFQPVIVQGTMDDIPSKLGSFVASATLTKAGDYDLTLELNGLPVPTYIDKVTVPPAPSTSQIHSNFTGIADSYQTGGTITVTIYARDQFENFREASITDVFQLQLVGQSSGDVHGPINASNIGPGLYSASFMFTKIESYTVSVKLGGGHIKGSPVPNIEVFHSLVQAEHSHIVFSEALITAGQTNVWKLQAKDIFQNIVIGTNERFAFEIQNLNDLTNNSAQVEYLFSLYSATFRLTKAD